MNAIINALNNYRYRILLAVILVLAFGFRAYHITQIPLTNDELSALYRLQFSSFSQLITLGVTPDGHPAFVQVFLYYYIKIFGTTAIALKLPFIVFSVAAIYAAFKLFSVLYSQRVALMVSITMCATQFFVMHGQLARPYSAGLLWVLLFAWYLHKPNLNKTKTNKFAAFVFLFLAASTHYIALLTAIVILLLWVRVDAKRFKQASIISLSAFVLYLPQIFIFIHQLKVGGVGTWLGKPHINFIYQFWEYSFNYQPILSLILFVLLFAAIMLTCINGTVKKHLLPLGVFTLTFIITFVYSVLRNPVLQFPVLLFAWPFMLAFIYSAVSTLPKYVYAALFGLILFLQVYSLTKNRQHYQVFYNQSYKACVDQIANNTPNKTPLLLNGNQQFYFDYYFNKTNYNPNYINTRIDSLSPTAFNNLLNTITSDTLAIGHAFYLPIWYFEVAKLYFPFVIKHHQNAFNETYILCRTNNVDTNLNQTVFDVMESTTLYSKSISKKVNQPSLQSLRIIATAIYPIEDSLNNASLVLKVFDAHNTLISESYQPYKVIPFNKAIIAIDLPLVNHNRSVNILAFVLNDKNQKVVIKNIAIKLQKGNSLLYGTVENITPLTSYFPDAW
ncbi:MAG: hypothetical protein KBG11_08025 [Bacteroidia bacterium]|nr:hypothetical protein [Bacteroidia bacterium]